MQLFTKVRGRESVVLEKIFCFKPSGLTPEGSEQNKDLMASR